MDELTALTEEIAAKEHQLQEMFDKAGPELKMSDDEVAEVQRRDQELTDLRQKQAERKKLHDIKERHRQAVADDERVIRAVPHPDGKSQGNGLVQVKSLGEVFAGAPEYKAAREQGQRQFSFTAEGVDLKTLMAESGTGFAPQAIRTGVVVPSAQQMPRIVDLIPTVTTDQVAIKYMEETTFVNNAAETGEGGPYGEAALGYDERTSPVQKIAVILPVTDEQMADPKGMEGRINNRLLLMLRQRLDRQIVSGDGTGNNLLGLLNRTGILTQPRSNDVSVDAVLKALTQIRNVGFADPNAIVMNPTDWTNIRLLKTADGQYLFGFPSDAGTQRLWGLPVVESTFVPQGKAIPADFATHTELDYKQGIEFEVSNSHLDYFGNGKLAIRAQFRVALVVYRAAAICQVTGL